MEHSKTILIVEDEKDIREALADALHAKQYTVLTAKNGKEGLAWFSGFFSKTNIDKEPPTIIFLDLNMPVVDGLTCLAAIKKQSLLKNIPAIIYSTTVTPEFAAESRRLGAHSVFKKPDDFKGLKHYLRTLLT